MNKKLLLWGAISFLLSTAAGAQTYLGAHYGAGVSTVYFLPHQSESWRLQPYYFGVTYSYFVEKHVGLQLELNYGTRRHGNADSLGHRQKIYSSVLELPTMLQVKFSPFHNFNVYVNAIAYAAYYLSNEETTLLDDATVRRKFDYNNWNNFDFGVGGGLGFGYTFGTIEVGIDARFTTGLSELYKQTADCYESLPQQALLFVGVKKVF